MAFLTILAALLIERVRPLPWADSLLGALHRYTDRLAHDLNAGRSTHGAVGWLAAVCPWVLAALVSYYLLRSLDPALGWAWTVLVLYACLGFRAVVTALREIFDALRAGELDRARDLLARWRGEPAGPYGEADIAKAAVETALLRAHREVFGVIFWFILLPGPSGALLYRLAAELEQRWGQRRDSEFRAFGRFSLRAFHALDWLPVRMSATGFAIAGNFEDAVASWRSYAQAWLDSTQGILLASGAGALGIRLGGPLPLEAGVDFRPELGEGEMPDADTLQSALYLLWRTLIVWLVLLMLLTLAQWVGA